tara:strand:+ start:73 stop:243 length:171 start_codon:yes stop_codon:yes gene_type:complete
MKTENIIELWLDAEEELRKGNDDRCMELKDEFSKRYQKINKKEQDYVKDYLDSIGV